MFNFLGGKKDKASVNPQDIIIKKMMERCRKILKNMEDCKPSDAERFHEMIKSVLKSEKTIPMTFKTKCFSRAREYECNANMREVSRILHRAQEFSKMEKLKESNLELMKARKSFSKACTLGADDKFRKAFQRSVDVITLTGGIQHQGPTRAKPKYDENLRACKRVE